MLTGNHDYHYLKYVYQTYSGFQAFEQPAIQTLLEEALAESLLQVCYVWEDFLFSHAGVTKFWYKLYFDEEFHDKASLETTLNEGFRTTRTDFGFQQGPYYDSWGDNHYQSQSPLWVRPNSLSSNRIREFIHVVGHTTKKQMIYNKEDGIVFIDTLETSGEYLVIDNGIVTPTLNKFLK